MDSPTLTQPSDNGVIIVRSSTDIGLTVAEATNRFDDDTCLEVVSQLTLATKEEIWTEIEKSRDKHRELIKYAVEWNAKVERSLEVQDANFRTVGVQDDQKKRQEYWFWKSIKLGEFDQDALAQFIDLKKRGIIPPNEPLPNIEISPSSMVRKLHPKDLASYNRKRLHFL